MILAAVKMNLHATWRDVSVDKREEPMLNRLKWLRINFDEMYDFCMAWNYSAPNEFTEKELKDEMKITIEEFFECLSYRDTTWLYTGKYQIWVSGGMTWGDSPTNSYDKINKFSNLPVRLLKIGGFQA